VIESSTRKLEEVREKIEAHLSKGKQKELLDEYMKDLKAKAKVVERKELLKEVKMP
jgi:hypothetical protein